MTKHRSNHSKKTLIIAGVGGLDLIALAAALVVTGIVGLSGKAGGSDGIQVGVSSAGVTGLSDKASLPPSSTGNDAVSMNALIGLWWYRGWAEIYYWNFGEDGTFAYYVPTVSASVNYWNEYYLKGKYRVNGNVIECYDCYFDSYSATTGRDAKYFNASERINLPENILLETPLKDPKKVDDFSILFEFIDSMQLRIVSDRSGIHGYDADFSYLDYNGNGHNVTIPTHTLPGFTWPKDKLPPDLPEYRNGRIRSVEPITNSSDGSTIRIYIDKTTREDGKNYIFNLIQQEGWERTWMSEAGLVDLIEGGGGFNLRKPGQYAAYFEVGETSFYLSF